MVESPIVRLNRQRSRRAFMAHPMFAMADAMFCREKLGLEVDLWLKREQDRLRILDFWCGCDCSEDAGGRHVKF